ncbi:MAG: immunity 50 family protein [Acidobacteriota bacterium]|nr:immunity 50 family protein [Acidobacteriota bacterium]
MEGKIQNIELLTNIFGKFPSFHDAEVVQIILKRKENNKFCPILEVLINIKQYHLGNSFLVNLKFTNIFGLKLENFNHQNVLGNLDIEEFSDQYWETIKNDSRLLGVVSQNEIERLNFYIKFHYCFGVEAELLCDEVIVDSVKLLTSDELHNL